VILAFDVGNTETTIGLFDDLELRAHWRLTTDGARTSDEVGINLRALLASVDVNPTHILGAAIASVVPPVTGPLAVACADWIGVVPTIIDGASPLPITLQVDEPRTVGADRIVNTLAASRLYREDAIVVDLGTATTFDCITADGDHAGRTYIGRDAHSTDVEVAGDRSRRPAKGNRYTHRGLHSCRRDARQRGCHRRDSPPHSWRVARRRAAHLRGDGRIGRTIPAALHELRSC